MKRLIASLLVGAALFCCVQTASQAAQITVFAAASLTESLKEIAAAYEKQSGDKVVFNFAASGTLARQIEEGAPADIFFSADEAKADALEKKGLLVKEIDPKKDSLRFYHHRPAGQRRNSVARRFDQCHRQARRAR